MRLAALMRTALALGLLVTALAAGCGSDDSPAAAKTPREWADRLVNRFLRDIDRDLTVLNRLNNLNARVYLESGQPETVEVLEKRLEDLADCSSKLERVGPPPADAPPRIRRPLERVHANLERACPEYERFADLLLDAVPLVASANAEEKAKGHALFREAREPSERAALHYARALELGRQQPVLRAAGLLGTR